MLHDLVERRVRSGAGPGARRPRRLRASAPTRALVRETRLVPAQMVAPLFVVPGRGREEPIPSLNGHSRLSPDLALKRAEALAASGVGGVLLFGVPDEKDDTGRAAAAPEGPGPAALRGLREAGLPLVLIADVCLCEYTTHGHCGVLNGEQVDNDASLPALVKAAVTSAEAGV